MRQATDRQAGCRTGDEAEDRVNQGLQGKERQGIRCFSGTVRTVQCSFFTDQNLVYSHKLYYNTDPLGLISVSK